MLLSKLEKILLYAVTTRNIQLIQKALSKKADVINAILDAKQWTALHYASKLGNKDIVTLLLQNQANVHARTEPRDTPLHIAAGHGSLQVMDLLITNNADIEAKNEDGMTPLHYAARTGACNTVQKLIDAGANITCANEGNYTALHFAAFYNHPDVAEIILRAAAQQGHLENLLNVKNEFRNTAMQIAYDKGAVVIIQKISEATYIQESSQESEEMEVENATTAFVEEVSVAESTTQVIGEQLDTDTTLS